MFTSFDFINNESVDYDFFGVDYVQISDFDVEPDIRLDNSRTKPQTHGVYPTPTMRDGMSISLQFVLLASGFDDYVTKRKALMAAVWGANFVNLVSEPQMGVLSIGFSGETETWNAKVSVSAISGPKTWTESDYSEFMITWYSWLPFFYGGTTDTNFYRWT